MSALSLRREPLQVLALIVALAGVGYTVVYPFLVVTYPPMTDVPFHAAQTSVLRHYWDPSFHFQEQFSLHPLEVPYISMYGLGALFALVLPITWATKLMGIVMLLMLPAGLAVLFSGMKKSPLLGVLGLGVVWCGLTHWGFLNYVGAIGLYAMALGFTLKVLDAPTRKRQLWLTLALLGVFFTHIFRVPFVLLSVLGAVVVMYPATRRVRPVIVPLLIAGVVFGLWLLVRPEDPTAKPLELTVHAARLKEIDQHLFNAFVGHAGKQEQLLADRMYGAFIVTFVVTTVLFFWQGRHRKRSGRELWWGVGVTLLPLLFGAGFLLAYLVLPMRIGVWWYVYPREITPAVFVALAVVPDLPKQGWYRLPAVAAFVLLTGQMGFHVAKQWYAFEKVTADFRAIAPEVPAAPRLMYLVFDHGGSTKRATPFIHLPAWIQAEKGGWLSFHFASWGASPIRYREGADNPPPTPDRWEWTPHRFRAEKHGHWFDTFLIRHRRNPDYLFRADPAVKQVAHQGTWYLYRREPFKVETQKP